MQAVSAATVPSILCAVLVSAAATCMVPAAAHAEDGYDLWLRYEPVKPALRSAYASHLQSIVVGRETPGLAAARKELQRGAAGLLGAELPAGEALENGAVAIGTPRSLPWLRDLRLPLERAGEEGFVIRSESIAGKQILVIAANSDSGAVRGVFALLRRIQTGQPITGLAIAQAPRYPIRILNHWDNLDRSVERGYSGQSLWDWHKLPHWVDPRLTDYARANASIGINGAVLNNVNAAAEILTPRYLEKVSAIADVLRPWGVRTYLSARFTAPMEIGGLETSDPLDPEVRSWWKAKAAEIYAAIPDFGGFLVKANSEGQPGPEDYGRTHADGANMIADTLAPHGGSVMWRAFVYSVGVKDRARQAYDEFRPLDGRFRDNVVLQVKNGPIDFQPREPFHPLFGQMPRTPVVMEAQITKEYLGFATHVAFLGPLWEEVLDAQTFTRPAGAEVANTLAGMAGVANSGSDRNWSGSHFDQANWYAFGRFAWDPTLDSRSVAEEWVGMTWGNDREIVATLVPMMMQSREAVVDYMTPLGLTHLMATGHHYGPGPWVDDLDRPEWNPVYYHRADRHGIGFDRTRSGSGAVGQYARPLADCWSLLECVPEDLLLWFHRVSWDKKTRSGRTLWNELVHRYDRGVSTVRAMRRQWRSLEGKVDAERFAEVEAFLAIQEREAKWWRDASIAYFQHVSGRPLPPGTIPPQHGLDHYKALTLTNVPGH